MKIRFWVFFYIDPGEGNLDVHGIFDLGVFNLSFIFYCKKQVLVLLFITMDKLDKQWLVFEAFGVNFPWKDIKELTEEDLDYLYDKADEAKKKHEAAMAKQQAAAQAQQQAQMQAMMSQASGGGGTSEGYSFDKP